MAWSDFWKKLFGGSPAEEPAPTPAPPPPSEGHVTLPGAEGGPTNAPFRRIPAADNPWGVDLVDVRPFTHAMLSASTDMRMAENANISARDDGRGFLAEEPVVRRLVDARLRYRVEGTLHDGVLFAPHEMEDKWHLSVHRRRLLIARSWTRRLHVDAPYVVADGVVEIGPFRGAIVDSDEPPERTVALVDWLLRTHALGEAWPFPSPIPIEAPDQQLAAAAFNVAGRRVSFVCGEPAPHEAPTKPLRTDSVLHIAVARGDLAEIAAQLDAGAPPDLLGRDGLPVLTWALGKPDAVRLLLERGCPADTRSAEGATPLMNAVQRGQLDMARLLLDHGADPGARDARGFTALHRAAELGYPDLVLLLLERGAERAPEAQGHTPRSLAEKGGRVEIVEMLA